MSDDACERWSVLSALLGRAEDIARLKEPLSATLQAVGADGIFSLTQAVALEAVVADFDPDVIIDLGTGRGASCATFALASRGRFTEIYTLDVNPNWYDYVRPRLPAGDWHAIKPIIADIVGFDFSPLVEGAQRVFVFLDAHGFAVAAKLLSHLMPLIADKRHFVFCHDISDNRLWNSDQARSYGGKRLWRGTDDFFDNIECTALLNIDWMATAGEQALMIYDFCYRNLMPLRSVDEDVHLKATPAEKALLESSLFGGWIPAFDLAYFTMNNTAQRHFPAE